MKILHRKIFSKENFILVLFHMNKNMFSRNIFLKIHFFILIIKYISKQFFKNFKHIPFLIFLKKYIIRILF